MKLYGLIGFPLSHSFSPDYFKAKFERENITDAEYAIFPLEKVEYFLDICLEFPNLSGLNVTIPYKEKIIPFLDNLSKDAKAIGAVNTIQFLNGKKIGHNTDIYGFESSLKPLLQPNHNQALILGNGGAAKAVEFVLQKFGITFKHVSRHETESSLCYEDVFEDESYLQNYTLIINTTPVGMYPNIEECPQLPYEQLHAKHLLFDLVYNPEMTTFLRKGVERGAQIKNGLEMLHLQAEKSWEIWQNAIG